MQTLEDYLERLASKKPVPGGGSAAALVGAIAAALVAMVARIGAPDDDLAAQADRLRASLEEARLRDEGAFAAFVAAQALPKRDELEKVARRHALDAALEAAAQAPLHAAALAVEVLRLSLAALDSATNALASDVGCAAEFAHAALLACAYNVRINHRYMADDVVIERQASALGPYEDEASATLAHVRERVTAALRRA